MLEARFGYGGGAVTRVSRKGDRAVIKGFGVDMGDGVDGESREAGYAMLCR